MNPTLQRRVEQAFYAALDQPEDARPAFVRRECSGDLGVQEEVLALLEASHDVESSGFMDSPSPEVIRKLLADRTPAAIPERIGDYAVEHEIARGGMGVVYKGHHPMMRRDVAIKVFDGRAMPGAERDRFMREVAAIAQLRQENIVAAYHAFEESGLYCLVMEFVDGPDLDTLVRCSGPRSVSEACEMVRQAALGLQHACENGVVHRDVKPSNLLLAADGTVKLSDLGLAMLAGEASRQITAPGTAWGTLDYMAPEQQADMHQVDIRADIYALGCTFYFLLTGRPPFAHRKTPTAKLLAHQQETPPPVGSAAQGMPPELQRILDRMLAKDPSQRFATPVEVARTLEPFCRAGQTSRVRESEDTLNAEPTLGVERSGTAGCGSARQTAAVGTGWIPVALLIVLGAGILAASSFPAMRKEVGQVMSRDIQSVTAICQFVAALLAIVGSLVGIVSKIAGRRGATATLVLSGVLAVTVGLWVLAPNDTTHTSIGSTPPEATPKPIPPAPMARPFVSTKQIQAAIAAYLESIADPSRRQWLRFLVLTHLHNDPAVSPADMERYIQAVHDATALIAKDKKSLQLKPLEGTQGTVFVLDSLDLHWDTAARSDIKGDLWRWLVSRKEAPYPYGLDCTGRLKDTPFTLDEETRKSAERIRESIPLEPISYVRADWFIVQANSGRLPAQANAGSQGGSPSATDSIQWARGRYEADLDFARVACELGVQDAVVLGEHFKASPTELPRDLAPVMSGGVVSRAAWSAISSDSPCSMFQQTAGELGLGTPQLP